MCWMRNCGCCGQCAGNSSCGETESSTSAACCDTCGLTINPDGTPLTSQQSGGRLN